MSFCNYTRLWLLMEAHTHKKSDGFGPHYDMYQCFLDNNMLQGILAEYFKHTTMQTVSICASIRIFRDFTFFKGA